MKVRAPETFEEALLHNWSYARKMCSRGKKAQRQALDEQPGARSPKRRWAETTPQQRMADAAMLASAARMPTVPSPQPASALNKRKASSVDEQICQQLTTRKSLRDQLSAQVLARRLAATNTPAASTTEAPQCIRTAHTSVSAPQQQRNGGLLAAIRRLIRNPETPTTSPQLTQRHSSAGARTTAGSRAHPAASANAAHPQHPSVGTPPAVSRR